VIFIKYFLTRREKPGGPLKELRGPLEGRGQPVEKHWSRRLQEPFKKNLISKNSISFRFHVGISNVLYYGLN